MADFGVSAALAIGTALASTAATAGASAYQASQQNKALRRSEESTRRATEVQNRQLAAAAGQELEVRRREADQTRGRIRVSAGEAGIGLGGSYAAMMRQADFDLAMNQQIIRQNFMNNVNATNSGYMASMAQLSAQRRNPLLDAFTGGLQGMSTGLSIGSSLPTIETDDGKGGKRAMVLGDLFGGRGS